MKIQRIANNAAIIPDIVHLHWILKSALFCRLQELFYNVLLIYLSHDLSLFLSYCAFKIIACSSFMYQHGLFHRL